MHGWEVHRRGRRSPPIGQPVELLGAQTARELLGPIDGTLAERRQAVLDAELLLRQAV
ncbi:hypothetical protein [Kutzneria sp. NPDC051319]|uniref:hypothetical protein n=1 Tax=Kutzneria sp. NPDC051319 TaxID=3155047 RepID=UPI00342CD325